MPTKRSGGDHVAFPSCGAFSSSSASSPSASFRFFCVVCNWYCKVHTFQSLYTQSILLANSRLTLESVASDGCISGGNLVRYRIQKFVFTFRSSGVCQHRIQVAKPNLRPVLVLVLVVPHDRRPDAPEPGSLEHPDLAQLKPSQEGVNLGLILKQVSELLQVMDLRRQERLGDHPFRPKASIVSWKVVLSTGTNFTRFIFLKVAPCVT